ncbi:ATP12 family chaperone protein [Pelagibius sp. Alg239-R121]|uniref:ATP12 family chaperone protein n=1 Tax=Pelagibius sp. Alg239-R121 TaxID=2993448 RepID=UPI0024A70AA9|nr:ATP12 family protein [Pelagibius sp. Alg239-R121]
MNTSSNIKRFYKKAEAVPSDEKESGGFTVALDGRILRTPNKAALQLPTLSLAEAVAAEWNAQGETIHAQAMPMMTLACTAIDWVHEERAHAVDATSAFAEHDLVCYWAEDPPELVERQQVRWQPLLDWLTLSFDAPLVVISGILARPQPEASVAALRHTVERLDDMTLTALHTVVSAGGSLVIGLALLRGRLTADEAFAAALLDELFQVEFWGEDSEAAARHAGLRAEFHAAASFLTLLRG